MKMTEFPETPLSRPPETASHNTLLTFWRKGE
jgi:hypothetical protein